MSVSECLKFRFDSFNSMTFLLNEWIHIVTLRELKMRTSEIFWHCVPENKHFGLGAYVVYPSKDVAREEFLSLEFQGRRYQVIRKTNTEYEKIWLRYLKNDLESVKIQALGFLLTTSFPPPSSSLNLHNAPTYPKTLTLMGQSIIRK